MVPRPGDPDFIPSQLPPLWGKCGKLWLRQALAAEAGCPIATAQVAELPPKMRVDPDAPIDWPWRPRELEALLLRFNLLVDTKRASTAGRGASVSARQGSAYGGGGKSSAGSGRDGNRKGSHVSAAGLQQGMAAAAAADGGSQLCGAGEGFAVLPGGPCGAAAASAAAAAAAAAGQHGGTVLTYDGFTRFWEEAGLKDWLDQV